MQLGHFNAERAHKELKERYNIHFVDLFIQNGFTVYLFGGSLRDMVLGREWKDADIRAWIPLPPKIRDEKTKKILSEAGIKIKTKIILNDSFTIYRFLPDNSPAGGVIDFTVVSDQWAVGPDFSINGLYFDLEKKELIDRRNALSDIAKKIIRTDKNPMVQFADEPHMIFRAIKCACQFGFSIEKETLAAMKEKKSLTEGTLAVVADNTFPGMTEWFIGNIFRGLTYNLTLFLRLWNEVGLTRIFIDFICKRIKMNPISHNIKESLFRKDKKYNYEDAIWHL